MSLPDFSNNSQGFTIIEILVVVSLIAILTGLTIPNFTSYLRAQALKQAQDQIVVDLRKIQNRALSGVGYQPNGNTTHWGVLFRNNTNTYHYFIASRNPINYSSSCNDALTNVGSLESSSPLPENIVIRMASAPIQCIYFDFERGNRVSHPSSLTTIRVSRPGDTQCIGIETTNVGRIASLSNPLSCN